jgi:hypothetical protein
MPENCFDFEEFERSRFEVENARSVTQARNEDFYFARTEYQKKCAWFKSVYKFSKSFGEVHGEIDRIARLEPNIGMEHYRLEFDKAAALLVDEPTAARHLQEVFDLLLESKICDHRKNQAAAHMNSICASWPVLEKFARRYIPNLPEADFHVIGAGGVML